MNKEKEKIFVVLVIRLIVFFHLRNKLAEKLLPVHAGWIDASVPVSFLLLLPF